MARHSISRLAAAGVFLLIGQAACTYPAAQERSLRRTQRIDATLALAKEREERSLTNMEWTVGQYLDREARSSEYLERDLLGNLIRRDLERWPARQQVHAAWLTDLLEGDPANIDRTVPKLIN